MTGNLMSESYNTIRFALALYRGADECLSHIPPNHKTCCFCFALFSTSRHDDSQRLSQRIKELAQYDLSFSGYTCLVYLQAIFSTSHTTTLKGYLARALLIQKVIVLDQEPNYHLTPNVELIKLVEDFLTTAYKNLPKDSQDAFLQHVEEVKESLIQNHAEFDPKRLPKPQEANLRTFLEGMKESKNNTYLKRFATHPLFEPYVLDEIKKMVGLEQIERQGPRLSRNDC